MQTDIASHLGELYALLTAVCWTVTAMSFESAGKKVGSLPVNILRLLIALVFFSVHGLLVRGLIFPTDASTFTWTWMGLSALIGFCIGDLLLFKAFVLIGSRLSMLIMTTVPPMAALMGLFFLDEHLSILAWFGMLLTLFGISITILSRNHLGRRVTNTPGDKSRPIDRTLTGYLFAIGGAFGQAFGLVLSKYGMGQYDAVAATHIRVIVGAIGFAVIFSVTGQWHRVGAAILNRKGMRGIMLGSFFGPFLGVSFSLLAIQNTDTGIASTIMAMVPVMIIPPAIVIFKEKVRPLEITGAVIAVVGVALLFL